MSPRSHARAVRGLEVAAIAVMLFSAAILVLPGPTQLLFNIVAFGTPEYPAAIPEIARPYVVFVYRVLGAVMIGWMLAIWTIIRFALRRGVAWAWWAVALSIGGWFVIDTAASLLSGYPGNALLNLGFGIAFAVPLWACRAIRRGAPLS